MKQYNKIPYELLVYYSINAIVRKTPNFDFNGFWNKIIDNKTRESNLYKYDGVKYDYFDTFPDISVFDLGKKFGEGDNYTTDGINVSSIFQLDTPYTYASGDYVKFNGNKIIISDFDAHLPPSYMLSLPISELRFISKSNAKIYSTNGTFKCNIVSQNGIFDSNNIHLNYFELYGIFRSDYESVCDDVLQGTIPFYNLSDIRPRYKTVSDNVLDIHNFIMDKYFLWGYYTGLNSKIKAELLTHQIFNRDFYTFDKTTSSVIPKYDNTLFTSDIAFNNYLILKYQETNYLIAKYKYEVELYEKYFNMGVADATLGKTNLSFLNHTSIPLTYYKRLNPLVEITERDYLWELMALENFNREYIPYLITQTNLNANILPESSLLSDIIGVIINDNHFSNYFNAEITLPKFDLRNYTSLYGQTFGQGIAKNKYDICNDGNPSNWFCNTDSVIDNDTGGNATNWSAIDFANITEQIRLAVFERGKSTPPSNASWKTKVGLNGNISAMVKDLFNGVSAFIDYLSNSTSSLEFTFNNSVILWNVINDYIEQLKLSDEIILHKDDKWNLINLFNGYIYTINNVFPVSFDMNPDFLYKFRSYFTSETHRDCVYHMCHNIIRSLNLSLTEYDTADITETLSYSFIKSQTENNSELYSIQHPNIGNIISQIVITE